MASFGRGSGSGPTDYYDILDVSRTASASDIKRAYLRLARRWHPDKNDSARKSECEARFKAITEAYDTLRDGAKRAHYDRFGAADVRGPHEFSFAQADEMFRNFFSVMHPSRRRAAREAEGRAPRDAPGADGMHGSGATADPFDDMGGGMFGGMGGGLFGGMGGGLFGGMGGDELPSGYGRSGDGGRDPFPDMFRAMESMMGEMAGAGGAHASSTFVSSSSSGGLGGGDVVARSSQTQTVARDGRRVTRTVNTVRYADGREETTTDESTGRVPGLLGGTEAAEPPRRLMR